VDLLQHLFQSVAAGCGQQKQTPSFFERGVLSAFREDDYLLGKRMPQSEVYQTDSADSLVVRKLLF